MRPGYVFLRGDPEDPDNYIPSYRADEPDYSNPFPRKELPEGYNICGIKIDWYWKENCGACVFYNKSCKGYVEV